MRRLLQCVLPLLGLPLCPALGLPLSHLLQLPQCSQHCRWRSGLTRTFSDRSGPLSLSMPGERRQQRVLRYVLSLIVVTHCVLSSCLLICWQQDARLAQDPEPINANHIIDDHDDTDSNCPCCRKVFVFVCVCVIVCVFGCAWSVYVYVYVYVYVLYMYMCMCECMCICQFICICVCQACRNKCQVEEG